MRCHRHYLYVMYCLAIGIMISSSKTLAFAPVSSRVSSSSQCWNAASNSDNDEIEKRLERARQLLEKSRAKLAAQQGNTTTTTSSARRSNNNSQSSDVPLPFFATRRTPKAVSTVSKREQVIKSRDEATGLITTDGDKMARLSEQEEWEVRPLLDVFESETKLSSASQQLMERDVAASIWNLRKTLHNEDYKRIFDTRNRFIGEDN